MRNAIISAMAPTKGLNIKVTTYADGTKSTVKMMNK